MDIKSSKYLWLIDNGHGGLINGEYQTEGKRSPTWPDGSQLFEGEFTRAIAGRLVELMVRAGIRYVEIAPEAQDIGLAERVARANSYASQNDCIFVSIHANAGGGRGIEVFTSPGQTRADQVAEVFYESLAREFAGAAMRSDVSDGDYDKEANFYVLKNTRMPAILTENFFMDNESECRKYLMTGTGRDRIAMAHFRAIMQIEAEG